MVLSFECGAASRGRHNGVAQGKEQMQMICRVRSFRLRKQDVLSDVAREAPNSRSETVNAARVGGCLPQVRYFWAANCGAAGLEPLAPASACGLPHALLVRVPTPHQMVNGWSLAPILTGGWGVISPLRPLKSPSLSRPSSSRNKHFSCRAAIHHGEEAESRRCRGGPSGISCSVVCRKPGRQC